MRTQQNLVDATEPLTLRVKECHLLAAVRKSRKSCAIAVAGRAEAHIEDISVDANIVKIKYKGNTHWTRYQATPTVKAFIAAFDRRTIAQLHKLGMVSVPEEGVEIVLRAPRKAVSLEKLRGKRMKEIRAKSAEKRKQKQNSRAYTRPDSLSLGQIRSGQGYAP